ncbi:MAG: hypothetical protein WA700_05715 [Acidobacteriaceae bacterium]
MRKNMAFTGPVQAVSWQIGALGPCRLYLNNDPIMQAARIEQKLRHAIKPDNETIVSILN